MNQCLTTFGQCSAPVAAAFRRPASVRIAQVPSRPVLCTAVPAADGPTPSTSSSSDQIAATPRLEAALQRVVASKRQAAKLAEGASMLDRILANTKHTLPFLLAAAPVAFVPPTVWQQLGGNYVFMTGFCGWFIAQFLKIFTKWYKTGIFSVKAFVDSGGMPSSHSSLCSSVTTAVALQQGLGSPLFAMCVCFSVIVMYDAMGVRRHAGLQAEVLNAVVEDLLEGHPVSERKLKEVLGHTPRQVLCGAALGVLVGLVCPRPF
jgi:acid phosphatase family membrane protein YuiD